MRALGWLVMGLVACGGGDDGKPGNGPDRIDPLSFEVDQLGPYNAGFRSWAVTYDVLGGTRTIPVNVWYPTDDLGGAEVRYSGLAPDDMAFGEATPILPIHEGGFPLFAYTHGHQGYGGTSADLMRWVASHGWVAVAPDHVGNLLTDNPDNEDPWFDALRPMDVKAAVDSLAALDADDPLAMVVTDRYILSGHSRGCTTLWSLLGTPYDPVDTSDYCDGCDAATLALFTDGSVVDTRAVAGLPMACGYNDSTYADDGFLQVDVPVLSMTGTNDNPESALAQWTAMNGQIDFRWLELEGGCHQTFALGACDSLDVPDGFWMVDTYATAFARAHLLGDEGARTKALLDGSEQLDPRAIYH